MNRFFLPLILFILSTLNTYSQKLIDKEFGFITDNDVYVSYYLDEYYTNGLELFYKKASISNLKNYSKKITSFKIGQKIYNPFRPDVTSLYRHDRPFAGYTYGEFNVLLANKSNLFTVGLEIGYTGKKSGAQEAQEFVHTFYSIREAVGWKYQIKQKIGASLKFGYQQKLLKENTSLFESSWLNSINIGNIFTNIKTGFALKIRNSTTKQTSINNSLFYNTALETNNLSWIKEMFWGFKTYLNYQIIDTTVTGELHDNFLNKSFHKKPWVWYNEIGYYVNLKRWNFSYQQIFHTQNTQEMITKWVRYGSIKVSFKF